MLRSLADEPRAVLWKIAFAVAGRLDDDAGSRTPGTGERKLSDVHGIID